MISVNEQKGDYCVYAHVNKLNRKMYIGVTSMEVEKRWCNGRGYVKCPHFYNSIKKYGWDNFDHIIILSNLSKEMALIVEENLIRKFNTTNQNFGYNCTTGGQAPRHSEETKEKLRRAKLGKEMSDETKEKISNTLKGEGCYWFGKHLSDEHKQKLRDRNLGKSLPQEVKDKISKLGMNKNGIEISQYSLKGEHIEDYITASEATRMTGADTSDIVKCCKGKKRSAGGYQWRYKSDGIESLENIEKKKILQYDKNEFLIKKWDSQMDAARYFNITPEAIGACLKGRSKTCKGYIWKYSD